MNSAVVDDLPIDRLGDDALPPAADTTIDKLPDEVVLPPVDDLPIDRLLGEASLPPVDDLPIDRLPGDSLPPLDDLPIGKLPEESALPPVDDLPIDKLGDTSLPPVDDLPISRLPGDSLPPVDDIPISKLPEESALPPVDDLPIDKLGDTSLPPIDSIPIDKLPITDTNLPVIAPTNDEQNEKSQGLSPLEEIHLSFKQASVATSHPLSPESKQDFTHETLHGSIALEESIAIPPLPRVQDITESTSDADATPPFQSPSVSMSYNTMPAPDVAPAYQSYQVPYVNHVHQNSNNVHSRRNSSNVFPLSTAAPGFATLPSSALPVPQGESFSAPGCW